jgi:hypothetical protein
MKIETITLGGHSSFTTNMGSVYIDIIVGENKRSLAIELDGRIFDETDPDNIKEI